jgi:hypothetical protein
VTLQAVASVVKNSDPSADNRVDPGPDPVDEREEALDIRAAARDGAFVLQHQFEERIRQYASGRE